MYSRRRGHGNASGGGGPNGCSALEHARLMTQLVPGELIVNKGGHDEFIAVGEGLVEITNEHVSIVTNMAIAVDKIDEAAAEEARQRAAARLRAKLSYEGLRP